MKTRELKPIKEDTSDYDAIEAAIRKFFRQELYEPLLKEMGTRKALVLNSSDSLHQAIQTGQIVYDRGAFTGRFDAQLSRELKSLGAKWDRTHGRWKVPLSSLPVEIKAAIKMSESVFAGKLTKIDERLRKILPEEIADKLKLEKLFDRTLFKVDREVRSTLSGITVAPQLTDERRARIAREWQDNMKLYVKGWAEEEIVKLRKMVQANVFTGNRYESFQQEIQKRYGVSANKAKFLARQETSLLVTKFKETRYTDAGVMEYKWGCVAGSKNHPVRDSHKKLEGKVFRWDNPPITTEPGEPTRRNNPGQDFNCRCFARPIVRFK